MQNRPYRPFTRLIATASGVVLLAGAAEAQVAASDGAARYLSWPNRPASTTPGDQAARTRARTDLIPRRIAPSHAVQPPLHQAAPPPVQTSRGLTPAGAWLTPRTVPSWAPGAPDPTAMAATILTPVAAGPDMASGPPPAADPMAPRRDAPIFRLQPQGPGAATGTPTAAGEAPGRDGPGVGTPTAQGARYYSVHRDAGRQPDPTVIPDPVFFDSVTLDLAEPPQTEPLMRDAQGRRRPVANADPSLP
ncbi:MAG: hypothetical protein K2X25_00610 [Caulobacteraceae bacterium]|nr:hypothetical protein [Caulobacteraceae bacterium]